MLQVENPTRAGYALAWQVDPAIAVNYPRWGFVRDCSALCAYAAEHHSLAEDACNGYPDEDRITDVEAKMVEVIGRFPRWGVEEQPWGVVFSGDPRGCTVKLTGPEGVYDSWGGDGVCVPQDEPLIDED